MTDELPRLVFEHLVLVVGATLAAVAVAVPVGIWLTRRPGLARPALAIANVLQTVPSLALFGFLIPVLGRFGIGRVPALIALFLYALLPILRNTVAGIQNVDPAVREAGRGMGMTDGELLRWVELPLALGVIAAGVRTATVISIGTATIAAAIGAGGLGTPIFRGLRMNDTSLVLAGAVPAALLALVADALLGLAERRLGQARPSARAPGAKRLRVALAGAAVLAVAAVAAAFVVPGSGRKIRVCSKDFTEQVVLAEIVAQTIESTGLPVERRFELGGDLCHRGLVAGEIDAYVEYTGTASMAILKDPPSTDARAVRERVRTAYAARFAAEWLPPLGFENTFAILVRGDDAKRLGLRKISDVAAHAPKMRAAFGQDFISREDGYRGFARTYGLSFAEPPREMDLSLVYRALAAGQVDLVAGNSTDGLIDKLGLVQLEDDRAYFPPYEAAPVARTEMLSRQPEVRAALERLGGSIDGSAMRAMNLSVDADKRAPRDVARDFIEARRGGREP